MRRLARPFLPVVVACALAVLPACASPRPWTAPQAVTQPGLPAVTIAGKPGDAEWPEIRRRGFATVVDFRTAGEGAAAERALVTAVGMDYVHVPVAGPKVTEAAADELARVLDRDAGGGVLLAHCSSGNRAAGVWAVYVAKFHGLSPAEALAEGDARGITKDAVREAARRAIEGL